MPHGRAVVGDLVAEARRHEARILSCLPPAMTDALKPDLRALVDGIEGKAASIA